MISLKNIKNQKLNMKNLVEALFFTLPLSFIIGNLILSAHLFVFIVFSLFLIKKRGFAYKFNKVDILLIIFILYLFVSTLIQFPNIFDTWVEIVNLKIESLPLENHPIFKSFLIIRFLILIIILNILVLHKIIDIKKIFYFSLICTSFVSLDVIIQYILGYDIFGYSPITPERYTGPFGDETIARSFIQRFSFISFFGIYILNFKNKNLNQFFLFFSIILCSTAILLSGNRMPMILFLLGCFVILFFIKNFRLVMTLSLIVFSILFFSITSNNESVRTHYSSLLIQINILDHIKKARTTTKIEIKKEDNSPKKTKSNLLSGGYRSLYETSLEIWKDKPLFGYGLKSFRFKCWEILSKEKNPRLSCGNHSHNYYLEILVEGGIIGIILIIGIFIIIIKDSILYLKKNYNKLNSDLYLFAPILLTFFLEIWPIKSTGSFFTNWNATFLWLIVALITATIYKGKIKFK